MAGSGGPWGGGGGSGSNGGGGKRDDDDEDRRGGRPGPVGGSEIDQLMKRGQEQLDRAFFGPDRIEGHEGPGRDQRQNTQGDALPRDHWPA